MTGQDPAHPVAATCPSWCSKRDSEPHDTHYSAAASAGDVTVWLILGHDWRGRPWKAPKVHILHTADLVTPGGDPLLSLPDARDVAGLLDRLGHGDLAALIEKVTGEAGDDASKTQRQVRK